MQSSRYHILARADDGFLYAWGQNEFGQLFSMVEAQEILEPAPLSHASLPSHTILDASCGRSFSMVLTTHHGSQHLWMAGTFNCNKMPPTVCEIDVGACQIDGTPLRITRVHCGGFFAVLLTEDGNRSSTHYTQSVQL